VAIASSRKFPTTALKELLMPQDGPEKVGTFTHVSYKFTGIYLVLTGINLEGSAP
jgi:hypothetical protein